MLTSFNCPDWKKMTDLPLQIEVPEDASDEEIHKALLEGVDFNYIRESVEKLKGLVDRYGPFNEIEERQESSDKNVLTRTYDERSGWVCEGLESIESARVWTIVCDQWNGYSWISNGYQEYFNRGAAVVETWFISEKPYPTNNPHVSVNTEFIINTNEIDSDGNIIDDGSDFYHRVVIWDLIDSDDLSDEDIIDNMYS